MSFKKPSFESLDVNGMYLALIDNQQLHVRRYEAGQYNVNANLIAFTSESGSVYIAKHTVANVQELEGLGYRETALGVPYSNGLPPEMEKRTPSTYAHVVAFLKGCSDPEPVRDMTRSSVITSQAAAAQNVATSGCVVT